MSLQAYALSRSWHGIWTVFLACCLIDDPVLLDSTAKEATSFLPFACCHFEQLQWGNNLSLSSLCTQSVKDSATLVKCLQNQGRWTCEDHICKLTNFREMNVGNANLLAPNVKARLVMYAYFVLLVSKFSEHGFKQPSHQPAFWKSLCLQIISLPEQKHTSLEEKLFEEQREKPV